MRILHPIENNKKHKIEKRIDQERRLIENSFEWIQGSARHLTKYAKTVSISMAAAFVTLRLV